MEDNSTRLKLPGEENKQAQRENTKTGCSTEEKVFIFPGHSSSRKHCCSVHVSNAKKPCTFTACSVGTAARGVVSARGTEAASSLTRAGICSHPDQDPQRPPATRTGESHWVGEDSRGGANEMGHGRKNTVSPVSQFHLHADAYWNCQLLLRRWHVHTLIGTLSHLHTHTHTHKQTHSWCLRQSKHSHKPEHT